jgi:hypothetical protein
MQAISETLVFGRSRPQMIEQLVEYQREASQRMTPMLRRAARAWQQSVLQGQRDRLGLGQKVASARRTLKALICIKG